MSKTALIAISALLIALPLTAIADDDKEYTPTTEIKTIDGKEYVVTYDAVKVDRDKSDREPKSHVHAGLFPIVNHRQHDDEKRTKFLYGPGFARMVPLCRAGPQARVRWPQVRRTPCRTGHGRGCR